MAGSSPHTARFDSTRWSMVLAARSRHSPVGEDALAELCSRYWRPLYSYVRRSGYSVEDAQDLTQAYFARLLEKNFLEQVDAKRGKFRSFLLASLRHYLSNEWDRNNALKRGGGVNFVSMEDLTGFEHDHAFCPSARQPTPEQIYDRNWAITLLNRATARVSSEFSDAGKTKIFEALKIFLSGDNQLSHYKEVAASLQMSEGAVRVAVHRLRDRFRAIMRAEIAQTIPDPANSESIDEELRYLLAVL